MDYIAATLPIRDRLPMTSRPTADTITSRWPLPAGGVRFLMPQVLVRALSKHALTADLYPLAFGFYPRAAGHSMRRRSHGTHLLIYCSSGRGNLQVEGETLPVRPGDLMILRAGQRHAYSADAADPWSILWVHYTGRLATDYNALFPAQAAVLHVGVQTRLVNAFEQLLSLRGAGFAVLRFVQGACLLKALLADFACAASLRSSRAGKQLDLEKLTRHMRENLGAELDLDALAATANLSKFHFSRRFRQHTGHAPIQFFIQMKMQRACELLDSTDQPIKAIAGAVGYQDAFYFSRIFKRTIGVSPQAYRQQHAI
jgi:AraC-like DNA-binding protein